MAGPRGIWAWSWSHEMTLLPPSLIWLPSRSLTLMYLTVFLGLLQNKEME